MWSRTIIQSIHKRSVSTLTKKIHHSNRNDATFRYVTTAMGFAFVGLAAGQYDTNSTITEEKFSINQSSIIGKGAFGSVHSGLDKSNNMNIAVKIVQNTSDNQTYISQELETLESIKDICTHPNIVKYLGHIDIPSRNKDESFFASLLGNNSMSKGLVFEFVEGKELFEKVVESGKLCEDEAAQIMTQMISAIRYLHEELKIIHGDVKLENILINGDRIKLCDFGSSQRIGEEKNTKKIVGTVGYCAPEVFRKNHTHVDGQLDVFSLGICLFIMLGGYHPFDSRGTKTETQLLCALQTQSISFENNVWNSVSDVAKDLISKMVEKDPTKRMKLSEIESHPFFKRNCL